MAQRYYRYVLLPNVRENIAKYKKLNCHLYEAIKKAIFKTSAFFKGFILPLVDEGCTAREAVIIGSILAKMSINQLDAAAALLKMTEFEYSIGAGFFVKTLVSKRYALPSQVISGLVDYFCQFEEQDLEVPVMWHQSVLALSQFYRPYFTEE